jgi:hypothetical protein
LVARLARFLARQKAVVTDETGDDATGDRELIRAGSN